MNFCYRSQLYHTFKPWNKSGREPVRSDAEAELEDAYDLATAPHKKNWRDETLALRALARFVWRRAGECAEPEVQPPILKAWAQRFMFFQDPQVER